MRRGVLVRPRSTQPGVGGSHDGLLVVRVREPAADGRANRGVVEAVAGVLGLSVGSVRISGGRSSRRKVLEIDGEEAVLALAWGRLLDDA